MSKLSNGTVVTDLHNDTDNHDHDLASQGYSIRHIETWNDLDQSFIVWDAPELTEADLPY